MYDICYELCHYFLEDLVKVKYFTVIDTFFSQFLNTDKYDVKLSLLQKIIPLTRKR